MSNAYYQIRVEPADEIKNSITAGLSRRCTETSIIARTKRRYMASLSGALEFAEGPTAQGYPAQWQEEQIAWCGEWDATLYSEW